MTSYELPTRLQVAGEYYEIRSDFRAILDIMQAINDDEIEDESKILILLSILYVDKIPEEHIQEAIEQAALFIDAGFSSSKENKPVLMDWEKDASLIIPAVNKVAGKEIRALSYLHWWTFIGYYMEIGESFFSNVVSIRSKKAKGKKLEKHEKEFYEENRDIIKLERKQKRSKEEEAELKKLFGIK